MKWWLFIVLCLWIFISQDINGLDPNQCSCYTFYDTLNSRRFAVNLFRKNDNFVSMETVEEFEFIKSQIKKRTTNKNINEWHIGLNKSDNGIWKWLTGQNLTYNVTWKGNVKPLDLDYPYATITREGLLREISLKGDPKGTICERNINTTSEACEVHWCPSVKNMTSSTSVNNDNTVTTEVPSANNDNSMTTEVPSKQQSSTKNIPSIPGSTVYPDTDEPIAATTYPRPRPSSSHEKPIWMLILAVALSVIIVVVCVVMIAAKLIYDKKNSRRRASIELSTHGRQIETDSIAMRFIANDVINNDTDQLKTCAVGLSSTTTNTESNRGSACVDYPMPEYASISKKAKENDDFNHDITMETGYASVDINISNKIAMTTASTGHVAHNSFAMETEDGYAIPSDSIKTFDNTGDQDTGGLDYPSVDVTTNAHIKGRLLSDPDVQQSSTPTKSLTEICGEYCEPDPGVQYAMVNKTKKTKQKLDSMSN